MDGTPDVAVAPHRLVGEGEVGRGSARSWTPFPRGKFHCPVLPLRGEGVMAEREGNHVQRGNQGATEKARQDWGSLRPLHTLPWTCTLGHTHQALFQVLGSSEKKTDGNPCCLEVHSGEMGKKHTQNMYEV